MHLCLVIIKLPMLFYIRIGINLAFYKINCKVQNYEKHKNYAMLFSILVIISVVSWQ